MRACATVLLIVAACGTAQAPPQQQIEPQRRRERTEAPRPGRDTPAEEKPATPIADQYRDVAAKIIAAAKADEGGWKKLAHLTDRIGHRLSGSKALDRAIAWAAAALREDGHENVRIEKVMVPHWERGPASAAIVSPVSHRIALLALGGSGATRKGGVKAEVVVVRDFAELDAAGARVKGKIVLFDRPMPAYTEEKGPGYGETVEYRWDGPVRAAKLGAVAALVRSVTARSLRSPHTGSTGFNEDNQKDAIPAAAVSVEDAALIARLAAEGPVTVELSLAARWHPRAQSGNVVAELRGREKPDEVVVIGGHIDSWDVGQGAHDDGGGCVTTMQALTLLRQLGLTPRRTIRVVLFTNEENGTGGARGYAADHAAELASHVMALESDSGTFAPRGYDVDGDDETMRRMADIVTLLEPIGAARIRPGGAGADVGHIIKAGVPGLGLWMDESTYFDYHHTEADTLDKVAPEDLRMDIAAVAVTAFVVADMPERLGKPAVKNRD